jgi:L-threonylcarbamoyladenylate synthase
VGIESTVLSLAGEPTLLRPGTIPLPDIEQIVGPVRTAQAPAPDTSHLSPGMHRRHYQPRTPLYLGSAPPIGRGQWLRLGAAGPLEFARTLYAELHRLDSAGLDWIAVEHPPETAEWAGVLDRLRRAARQ